MEPGDYVKAKKGWPEMGNTNGYGYSFAKVIKITPTGRIRIKELPYSTKSIPSDDHWITRSKMTITSHEPDPSDPGILIGADGVYSKDYIYRKYKVIPEADLDKEYIREYDSYN